MTVRFDKSKESGSESWMLDHPLVQVVSVALVALDQRSITSVPETHVLSMLNLKLNVMTAASMALIFGSLITTITMIGMRSA